MADEKDMPVGAEAAQKIKEWRDKQVSRVAGDGRQATSSTQKDSGRDQKKDSKPEQRGWWDKVKEVGRELTKPMDEYRKGGVIRRGKVARLHKGERAVSANRKRRGRSKKTGRI